MEEQTARTSLWKRFYTLSPGKQLVLAILVLAVCLVAFNVLRSGIYEVLDGAGGTTGVMSNKMYAPTADLGYPQESSRYARDAMQSIELATPQEVRVDMSGGTGAYDEATYDTRSYSAQFKKGAIEETCDTIESWKPRPEVVFERSVRTEQSCRYTVKVDRAYADGVLAEVTALKPTDLTANVTSAKRQMVQYDGELDILLYKQEVLTTTLDNSIAAYDELVALSKSSGDVEVLSRVIDSKLSQIERLTQQRLALAAQMESLTRRMAELEDRIAFVYFELSVQKYEVVDGDGIKDSWNAALREFTMNVNRAMQGMTLGLIFNLLVIAQFVLYALLLLVVVKYGWRRVKRFWQS